MGDLPEGTLASLPLRPILGHFRWPRPTRKAPKRPSRALASLPCILTMQPNGFIRLGNFPK
eukprot:8463930-Pyramimonas_sp.AAC.1